MCNKFSYSKLLPQITLVTYMAHVLWGEILTWAMNWIIFTNILRGVSRGTTLREPFGKSADTMLIRRLQGKKKISHNETMKLTEHSQTILPILHTMSGEFIFSHRVFVMFTKIPLAWYVSATFYLKYTRKQRHSPLSYSVAFTFYSNYINPQQSVQRFQCNSRHFRIFILFRTKENSSKFI